ncbi:Uncharacterized protein GBIM_18683 [Gryllus bimaculatus]|nr:Uncharacterized protein GBIM_18683 [Gryllus bimaculatus]
MCVRETEINTYTLQGNPIKLFCFACVRSERVRAVPAARQGRPPRVRHCGERGRQLRRLQGAGHHLMRDTCRDAGDRRDRWHGRLGGEATFFMPVSAGVRVVSDDASPAPEHGSIKIREGNPDRKPTSCLAVKIGIPIGQSDNNMGKYGAGRRKQGMIMGSRAMQLYCLGTGTLRPHPLIHREIRTPLYPNPAIQQHLFFKPHDARPPIAEKEEGEGHQLGHANSFIPIRGDDRDITSSPPPECIIATSRAASGVANSGLCPTANPELAGRGATTAAANSLSEVIGFLGRIHVNDLDCCVAVFSPALLSWSSSGLRLRVYMGAARDGTPWNGTSAGVDDGPPVARPLGIGGLVAVNSFGFGGANAHVLSAASFAAQPHLGARKSCASWCWRLGARARRGAPHASAPGAVQPCTPCTKHTRGQFTGGFVVAGERFGTEKARHRHAPRPRPVWFVGPPWAARSLRLRSLPASRAALATPWLASRARDIATAVTPPTAAVLATTLPAYRGLAAVRWGVDPDVITDTRGRAGCAYAEAALTVSRRCWAAYDPAFVAGAMGAVAAAVPRPIVDRGVPQRPIRTYLGPRRVAAALSWKLKARRRCLQGGGARHRLPQRIHRVPPASCSCLPQGGRRASRESEATHVPRRAQRALAQLVVARRLCSGPSDLTKYSPTVAIRAPLTRVLRKRRSPSRYARKAWPAGHPQARAGVAMCQSALLDEAAES